MYLSSAEADRAMSQGLSDLLEMVSSQPVFRAQYSRPQAPSR